MENLKVVAELPRPRVGVVGAWSEEELRELATMSPSFWFATTVIGLTKNVGQHELDLLICAETNAEFVTGRSDVILLGTFNQLGFGAEQNLDDGTRSPSWRTIKSSSNVLRRMSTHSEFDVAMDAFIAECPSPFGLPTLAGALDWREQATILADGDGRTLALNRHDAQPRIGAVRTPMPSKMVWVRAFLADWAPRDRERYKGLAVWNESREWRSPDENRFADAIAAANVTLAAAQAAHRSSITTLTAALTRAQDEEHRGARRMLTAKGVDLEAAVAACFEDLGFGVRQVDLETKGEQRRQDLELVDPTLADWVAVVEVKGKGKGSLNGEDREQLQKHLRRFFKAHHRDPSMGIIVMNSGADSPPAQRPVPFASDPHGLQEFAEDGNLVIPTTVLYKLHGWVRAGGDAAKARALIRDSRGRLDEAHLDSL